MDANDYNLSAIFSSPKQFAVPLFQRPYVWNKEENWEPLLDSVLEVAERQLDAGSARPHFLGAIVLDQLPTATGEIETRQIIDGQQRLTTLQLLLAAARDVATDLDADDFARSFGTLVENSVPGKSSESVQFKVWPTNRDREPFATVLTARSPESLKTALGISQRASDLGHAIANAYMFFHASLKEWLDDTVEHEFDTRLGALYRVLTQGLLIVVIDLGEDDDSQLIFETLNALGQPLLPADLVKNMLFHLAQKEGANIQQLYNSLWAPFDDEHSYWRQEVRQGRLKRARLDLILQHHLTRTTRSVIGATHLFAEFKTLVRKAGTDAVPHLEALRNAAATFRDFDQLPTTTREGRFRYRLEQLDTAMVYPLILELFAPSYDNDDRLAALGDIESYLVRRSLCCLTPKAYNRLFVDLLRQCHASGYSPTSIRNYLHSREGDSSRWPADDEVRTALRSFSLYTRMRRAPLRMVLEAIDEASRSDFSERIALMEQLTIEHVLPQDWEEYWPLPDDAAADDLEQRRSALHTIGNLTLVTGKLNPSMKNAAWAKKQDSLSEHSSLAMNRDWHRHAEWNEASIAERSERMCDLVVAIWPKPH